MPRAPRSYPSAVARPVVAALGADRAAAFVSKSGLLSLAFVLVEGIGVTLLAASAGRVAQAAPFAIPLVVGEALAACGNALARPRLATFSSLLGAGLATSAMALFFDAALAVSPWALGAGGVLALVQLACARIADHAVAVRRSESELVSAALDRVVWVPRALLLALLGRSEGEENA